MDYGSPSVVQALSNRWAVHGLHQTTLDYARLRWTMMNKTDYNGHHGQQTMMLVIKITENT